MLMFMLLLMLGFPAPWSLLAASYFLLLALCSLLC
jgi:hypothetical protein